MGEKVLLVLIPRWDNATVEEKGERLKRFCSSASSSVWNIVSKLGTKMKGYFNPSWWQNFPLWFHHVVKSMERDERNSINMAVSLKVIHWQQESNAQDKSSSSLKLMLLAEKK